MSFQIEESREQTSTARNVTTTFGGVVKPLKAIIHGPPVSGKTSIARRLCRKYGARYVSVQDMIHETLEDLRNNIEFTKQRSPAKSDRSPPDSKGTEENEEEEEEEAEEEEEEEEEGEEGVYDEDPALQIAQWEEQIRDINNLLTIGNGYLPDEYVVRLMKQYLSKDHCQSHGYVLDGYPKTLEQAKELFGQIAEVTKALDTEGGDPAQSKGEEGDPIQVGDLIGNATVNIMPDFVISLQASDDFICQRVMRMPEINIQNTHYTEELTLRRLKEYRTINTPDNTVLNFFDEAGIHPIIIDIMDKDLQDMDCTLEYLYNIFGPPIPGFGLTPEEEEELKKKEKMEHKLRQQAYLLEKEITEEKLKRENEEKMEEWAETFEQLQMEEEKKIAAESEPLRFYLMKHIFPTLAKGLSEVARIKPDDPVDYLAEFLFKENPEGKMFDPSYTREGEKILQNYEKVVEPTNKETTNRYS